DTRRATCRRSTVGSVHVWVSKSSLEVPSKLHAKSFANRALGRPDKPGHCPRRVYRLCNSHCRKDAEPPGTRHTSCLLGRSRRDTRLGDRSMAQRAQAIGTMHSNERDARAALLRKMDAYWRAANYLSVGQIYLLDNPLLKEPLRIEHVKPPLLGHRGTAPGLNFLYAHLNRIITERDIDMIFVTGPGHGGPALVANTWLEGTYSELYPEVSLDEEGMRILFRQFSFPGGIPSHTAPETPGSINEGGELGYSLAHAYGAAFHNPDL